MFKKLDKNKDGSLSKEELQQGITEICGDFQFHDFDWDELVNQLDTDKDGTINYTEFISAAFSKKKVIDEEVIKKAFDFIDRDKNGYLTRDELAVVFTKGQLSGNSLQVLDHLIKEADYNDDGKLSFKEFSQLISEATVKNATWYVKNN